MIYAYILSAASYLAGIGLNVTSGWLITMASFMPPVLTLSVAVVMVRFFGIGRSAARYLERIVSHRSVFSKLAKIRSDLYERITSNPRQLLLTGSGKLIKQVVDDVERAQEYELRVILPGAASAITLIGATLLAFWLQPIFGLFWLFIFVIVVLFLPKLALTRLIPIAKEIENNESEYSDQIRNSVHGALEAEIYGYLSELIAEVRSHETLLLSLERRLLRKIQNFQLITNFLLATVVIATISFSRSYSIPPVQVAMLIFLSLTAFESLLAWYPNLFTSGRLLLAKEKLDSIPASAISNKTNVNFDSIKAENYQAFWINPVTQPINFELRLGQALVLRGASGVGKSTSALGIFNFVNYNGSLKIGGVEVTEIGNLSELATGALQNGHIFNTSLRENLRIAGDCSDAEMIEVLGLLELEKLLTELPEGLDTVIGEYGRGLSGGELKRLVLARALLSKAPLIVLDEPTEHLDPELGERISRRILDKYKDRALLVITHNGWKGVPQQHLEPIG